MTSKPASRSARAMIFAPRSWPSRPGLATRIRSGRTALSEPGRVAVLPEDLAVDVGDLAERAPRLDRSDERRHQVLARARRVAHPSQRLARSGGVALALHAPHPIRLPRLHLERHAPQLGGSLLGDLVAVHAHHRLLAAVDLPLVDPGGLRDLLLRVADLDGADHPAELIDAVDVGAGLALHAVGERLDRPAAAERVDDVGDAALLREDLLRAQGDHRGLLRGERERLVERVGVQ